MTTTIEEQIDQVFREVQFEQHRAAFSAIMDGHDEDGFPVTKNGTRIYAW